MNISGTKVSLVINLDSRDGVDASVTEFKGHNEGTRAWDFFVHGIQNKQAFFAGFDLETIAYIDETVRIPDEIFNRVRELCDCVVLRKHFTTYRGVEPCGYANDIRYLSALSQATGEIISHMDADTAAFTRGKEHVEKWLAHLDHYAFVSYPAEWSPRPVHDESFGPHTWASTRAFACKREALKFDDLEHGLRDPEWLYAKYGRPLRELNWLEHFLARTNNDSVIYPPRDDDNLLIFCWDKYVSDVLRKLNFRSYDEVLAYVNMCGGIHYPCDCTALNL